MVRLNRNIAGAAAVLIVAWLLAYGPTIGGGFIKDDFSWIYHSRLSGWSSLVAIFSEAEVFYRPMVQLSFGVTEALFGNNPIPYALTNLILGLGCAASILVLARTIGLAPWAALMATAMWAFNFHGINMAIVWLSGRHVAAGHTVLDARGDCLSSQSRDRGRWCCPFCCCRFIGPGTFAGRSCAI